MKTVPVAITAKGGSTHKHIALQAIERCPVTRGCPTTMSAAAFERMCRAHRDQAEDNATLTNGFCLVCRGENKPPELTIFDLGPGQAMGDIMPSASKKGICGACGKQGSTVTHFGEWVCPSCQVVRIAAKNRPEMVWEQLRKLAPEFLDQKWPDAGAQEGVAGEMLAANRKTADELAAVLEPEKNEGLIACARRRMDDLEAALNNNTDLVMENRTLKESAGAAESSLLAKLREILGAGDGDIVLAAERAASGNLEAETIRENLGIGHSLALAEYVDSLLDDLDKKWRRFETERDNLFKEARWLQERLRIAEAKELPLPPGRIEVPECSCPGVFDSVLLELLLAALGDQVINIGASQIRALREVAR